jgi:DNA-binding PadR family transcriptional regulator
MAPRRLSRNLLAYLVLNLLAEAPMHPYEMKRLIHWRGKDQFVRVNLDSLYHTIAHLERDDLIEVVETNRDGRRPERTVYRATEAGREELRGWMAELLSEVPHDEFPRAIAALAHLPAMQPPEVREHLRRRAVSLQVLIAGVEAGVAAAAGKLPRVLVVEGEYALALKRAELEWVRGLIDDLDSGRLTWDPESLLQLANQARTEDQAMS